MKKILCLAAGLLALNVTTGFGQPTPTPPPAAAGRVPRPAPPTVFDPYASKSEMTKFNLDFPGGTPKQLVAAIEKAMGKPLNVIIPEEQNVKAILPPIKVSNMDVVRLFKAIEEDKYDDKRNTTVKRTAFYTPDNNPNPTDDSLWRFVYYERLAEFSIDFPGGTPSQFVKVVEKAAGKPLNVIINKDDENVELPSLKMDDVDIERLFNALEKASVKTGYQDTGGTYPGGGRAYSSYRFGYGFKTEGEISDKTIWYFHYDKPSMPPSVPMPKVSQFYSLADYLEAGLTVDDITTVIQNGWKMAGVNPTPELKYHKETKLLMAYGEPEKMATIDNVLKVLKPKDDFTTRLNRQVLKQTDSEPKPKKPADAPKTSEENSAK